MKNVLSKIFRSSIGIFLIVLGLLSGLFSTYATIIPISLSFKGMTKTIMIGIFIIVQISVFFLAMTKNYIARETPQHYILINRIANMLMLVSIISTITFFSMNKSNIAGHKESIVDLYKVVPFLDVLPCYDWIINITINVVFVWSVCIILDILAIKMPLIGFDIMLNIKEKINHATTFSMICAILTHKPKTWIETKYNNLGLESFSQESSEEREKVYIKIFEKPSEEIETEEKKLLDKPKEDPKANVKKINIKKSYKILNFDKKFKNKKFSARTGNTKKVLKKIQSDLSTKLHPDLNEKFLKVLNFLSENFKEDEVISSQKIKTKFNLTITEYRKILEQLKNENVVYTEGKKTYLRK